LLFIPFFASGINGEIFLLKKNMETLHLVTLYIHIAAGTVAFVAAPVALIVKKGAASHRRWGKIYFWAMTFITVSGIALSIMISNLFLFCVGFFSYHLVASGYRWLYRKNPKKQVARLDWFINGTAIVIDAALVGIGIVTIVNNSSDAFGYISTVFGLLGLNFAWQNIKQYLKPPAEKGAWLFNHIGGMIGGYIATVSAFSAVNMDFMPTILQWLWPTILGIPVIYFFTAYYKKKLSAGKKVEELVVLKEPGS
jgi:hypothetical protein